MDSGHSAPTNSHLRNFRLKAGLQSSEKLIEPEHLSLLLLPRGNRWPCARRRRSLRAVKSAPIRLIRFVAVASSSFDRSAGARWIVRLCRGALAGRAGSACLFSACAGTRPGLSDIRATI
jgi:hypothetical protein